MEKVKKGIDYSKGKIYRIVCDTTGLVYIGSTVETLCKRLTKHKNNYKCYLKGNSHFVTSFDILKNDNYKIILIENCPCNSKEELHRVERTYIESIECVNKYIPTRTNKEWIENNKDKIKQLNKDYYENNKEKKFKIASEWNKNNKDKKNKKIQCEYCNSNINKSNIKQHQKSLKCLKFQTIE